MEEPKKNKAITPSFNKKMVKVKINQNRAITGVGKAGDEIEMTEQDAEKYEQSGYVTILVKKEK